MKKKNKKQSKAMKVILTIIEIVCICVAAFACYKIYDAWHQNKKADETFDQLSEQVVSTPSAEPSSRHRN